MKFLDEFLNLIIFHFMSKDSFWIFLSFLFILAFQITIFGLYANSTTDYLLFSVEKNYLQHTKKALQQGANVNAKDYFQKTPLMYACENGNLEIVKILLLYGASVSINERDRYGKTAFMYAKEKGYQNIMKLLIDYGAIQE